MDCNSITIGAKAREARRARDMTQIQLAEIVGRAQNHISRLEDGHVNVSLDCAFRIADALDVTLDELRSDRP